MNFNCDHIYHCPDCAMWINEQEERETERIKLVLDRYQQEVQVSGVPLFKDWTYDAVCGLIENIKREVYQK